MNKSCVFCDNRGYIQAKWLGIDTPYIKPEVTKCEDGSSITFTDYGIPCPLCKFDEVTKEQFALFLSIVERRAINRDEKAVTMHRTNERLKQEIVKLHGRVQILEDEIEELINTGRED